MWAEEQFSSDVLFLKKGFSVCRHFYSFSLFLTDHIYSLDLWSNLPRITLHSHVLISVCSWEHGSTLDMLCSEIHLKVLPVSDLPSTLVSSTPTQPFLLHLWACLLRLSFSISVPLNIFPLSCFFYLLCCQSCSGWGGQWHGLHGGLGRT